LGDIQISQRKHPLYSDNISLWNLYISAAKGGEKFTEDPSNLFTHRLEDGTDYDERSSRSYFLNFCDTLPKIFNSYIFKEIIERSPDEILSYFRANTNGRNLSITDLTKRAGYYSSVFGVIHALVTLPVSTKKPLTKAQAKESKLSPIVALIKPSDLIDWSVDSNGNLNWIVIKRAYYRDEDISAERKKEDHYLVYTAEKWWIEDEDGNKVQLGKGEESSGPNPLGYIPLVTMYHSTMEDNRVGESLLKDIVYINRAILNWCSCVDEQIERQTFSQLVVPDDGTLAEKNEDGDDPLHQIGTSSIWTFPGDAKNPPAFISPNVENLQTIWTLIIDHIKEIYRLARLIGSSEDMYSSTSGRSKQLGFMSVNAALSEKAATYQQFENDISKIVYDILGEDITKFTPAKYPTTFDILSLQEELDTTIKIMTCNFSPTLNKTLEKHLSRKALPYITDDIKKEIEDEIESGTGEVNYIVPNSITPDNSDEGVEKGGQGNPNLDRVSSTFTTNNQKRELAVKKKAKDTIIK